MPSDGPCLHGDDREIETHSGIGGETAGDYDGHAVARLEGEVVNALCGDDL